MTQRVYHQHPHAQEMTSKLHTELCDKNCEYEKKMKIEDHNFFLYLLGVKVEGIAPLRSSFMAQRWHPIKLYGAFPPQGVSLGS